MFDFISYARDNHIAITVLPDSALEARDPATGYYEHASICADTNIHKTLDRMVARIGARKAKEYATRHTSQQLRDREDFFRDK